LLRLVHGNRIDALADHLVETLATDPPDVFADEIVVVPSAALGRWLGFHVATRLGITGGIRFPFPAAWVWSLFADVLPELPRESPLDPGVMTWRLVRLLADVPEAPEFAPVRRYLGAGDVAARYELARALAAQFETYAAYRPEWLARWMEPGRKGARGPAAAHPSLGEHEAWQASLWRALVADQPSLPHAHPSEKFFEAIGSDLFARERLPKRVSLFAVDALAPLYFEILRKLAEHVDVTFYLPNPSREYWGLVARPGTVARAEAKGATALAHLESGNPILASLGQHGRSLFDRLVEWHEEEVPVFETPREDTLLGCVQRDILRLAGDAADRGVVDVAEGELRSIAVHVCHGPVRQVEVLHDALLARFDADPTLQPEDVLVLVPDLETFAPAIDAVFGAAPPERHIPFAIADRAAAAERPIVRSLAAVVAAANGRLDAATVTSLLDEPRVARRFGLDADDLPLVRRWVAATGIRWGEDERSRAERGVASPTRDFTWRAGLERLVLGAAVGDDLECAADGTVLHGDVEGGLTARAGALVAFFDALASLAREVRRPRGIAQWATLIVRQIDAFHALDADDDQDARALREALQRMGEHAERAAFTEPVPFAVAWPHVERGLDGLAKPAGFLAGGVTVARLAPGRVVPARIVCVIGLDDGVFPASDRPRGFDLVAAHPQAGDRRRRDEDRYAFLTALTAARDAFIVCYTGRSEREDAELPPSTTLSDLLGVLARGYAIRGVDAATAVTVVHRLQPDSDAYFAAPGSPLFTYAAEWAPPRAPAPPAPFAAGARLDPPEERTLPLERLVRTLRDPARVFLGDRIDIRLVDPDGELDGSEPFTIGGLDGFDVRDRLLDAMVTGGDVASVARRARAEGLVPAGPIGEAHLAAARARAEAIARKMGDALAWLPPLPVELPVAGWLVTGRLDHLTADGLVLGRAGLISARTLLDAWVRHVVLCVIAPAHNRRTTVLAGEMGQKREARTLVFQPLASAFAETRLEELVDLHAEATQAIVPFWPAAAEAYVRALRKGESEAAALEAARRSWRPNAFSDAPADGERAYPALATRDDPDPLGPAFCAVALRVFEPLLAALDPPRNGAA
jgi:exodeoxyribonuclease V gamma subunit